VQRLKKTVLSFISAPPATLLRYERDRSAGDVTGASLTRPEQRVSGAVQGNLLFCRAE
jgi:hypothetical protein